MNGWTKEAIITIINDDISNIHKSVDEFMKNAETIRKETLEYLENLIEQIPNAISGPLIPKTPKVPRKKDVKRIQTIPEDDVVENETKPMIMLIDESRIEDQAPTRARRAASQKAENMKVLVDESRTEDQAPTRARRAASQKAEQNIKVQQSLGLGSKLRRPSVDEEIHPLAKTSKRPSRAKRTISVTETSDDEENKRPKKYSRVKQKSMEIKGALLIVPKIEPEEIYSPAPSAKSERARSSSQRASRNKRPREESIGKSERREIRDSEKNSEEPAAKRANIVDETMDIPETDVSIEPSLYEDAIGKSIPMNSTMNPNSTITIDRKMLNVTVVLESMQLPMRMNETMTIQAAQSNPSSSRNTLVSEEQRNTNNAIIPGSPRNGKSVFQSKNSYQNKMKALKETLANKEFDALITEDESSPERQLNNAKTMKRNDESRSQEKKRFTRSSLLSEDDDDTLIIPTPPRILPKDTNSLKTVKTLYKPNALFSPYAKDSVKKRVEAFEQAGLNSPKTVEIDAPTRVTRTKTRAMTAAETGTPNVQTVAQKLARKSLAKAKKISLTRQMKENEEGKENNVMNSAQKSSRLLALNDKMAQKLQQRTTPVSKSRLQMPMSVNRILNTPAGSQIPTQNKALTASRANIVTSVESFLAPVKTLTKSNSSDNLTEKRKKLNDEDARRKRDEALKAVTDEKRRKREEKELKNKLAREAKERLDMEKRLKQEKEREEKARAAFLLQEKQREQAERKRILQLQRAQEKEERRRQEEQIRLLRLQEQEEAERQLAEQKRREQEAERRKIAEARAQQAAAAEAARLKAQYIAKAKNANMKNPHEPTSYVLDSEPDDDISDDETRPKHVIPLWAQPNVRAPHLAMQQYIPLAPVLLFFGTKRCTPDLTDLFKGIKKERLQRTSSAIWKTPPRYSMMANE